MRDRTGAVVRRYRDDSGVASQQQIVRSAALRYGIDPSVLWGVYGAETNFGRSVRRSSKGAIGPFQFEPATARGLGINPNDFRQAAFGAAKYLSQFKGRGVRGMLAAYNAGPAGNPNNPETLAYVPRVLQLAKTFGGTGGADPAQALISAGDAGGSALPMGSEGLVPLLKALGQQRSAPSSMGLAAPSFSARPALPAAFQQAVTGGGPAPKPDISQLLALVQTAGGNVPQADAGVGGALGGVSSPSAGLSGGKVTVAPGADRAGVRTNAGVIRFVRQVSSIYGRPLTIGTGSNHSRLTVNGNVSAHWSGRAADVPLRGRALIRAGQDALIAAGMNPAKARRQTGGLFNVGGWQVIFNTHIGGDHTNHLHVGMRS